MLLIIPRNQNTLNAPPRSARTTSQKRRPGPNGFAMKSTLTPIATVDHGEQ